MDQSVASQPDDHKYDEHAVQSACDTLLRAEEIKDDKKLWDLCQVKLHKKGKAVKKITSLKDLRDAAYEVSKGEDEEVEEKEEV